LAVAYMINRMSGSSEAGSFNLEEILSSPGILIGLAIGNQLAIAAIVAGALYFTAQPKILRVRLNPSTATLGSCAVFAIGALGISQFFSSLITLWNLESPSIKYMSQELLNLTP